MSNTPASGKKNFLAAYIDHLMNPVSFEEKMNFARHLSIAIKSSMPVLEALRLIRRQVSGSGFGKIIDEIIKDVNNGQFLAQSMEHYDYVFGDFFVNMVRVGETSGNLSKSLLYLSVELRKQREIANKIRSAMIYPAVLLVATLGITAFMAFFIFPKILPIFSSMRVELPFTTVLLIATLHFLTNFGWLVLVGVIVLVVVVRVALTFENVRFVYHRFLLMTPVISHLIRDVTMTNFTRSLAVLLKSGMTIVDALQISKNTFTSLVYRREIEQMIESVKKGESMTRYIESRPRLFPPMVGGMIQVGESTGNLEENLEYLAEFYESEVNESVGGLTTIIEPLLLLLMGFLVGFVALSIVTPIYKITQGLQLK